MNQEGKSSIRFISRVYKKIMRLPQEQVDSLRNISSADIHESLGEQALMSEALRPIWQGAHLVGQAITVLNTTGDTLMLHRAVALSQPGDVLVIVSDSPSRSAMWGSMVTTVAKARGVAGAIVDGNARDTANIRSEKFPVWSRGISPCGSTRRGPGSVNVPVFCGGVWVNPGDVILADDDGIVVIPIELLETARAGALARMQKESDAYSQLSTGISPYEIWNMRSSLDQAGIQELDEFCPKHFNNMEE